MPGFNVESIQRTPMLEVYLAGCGAHLLSVLERIARFSRHDLQRVGLSATVGNPAAILTWLQGSSKRPGVIVDPPKQPARRQLLVARRPELADLATDAAKLARGGKSLFFCQSRSVTEAVAEHMRRAGTTVFVHHSAVSLEERTLAEERFHHGTDACIVCTSTLELGIDVGDLDRVLQHEAPDTVSSFLQRMGRTGRRAGQVANTTFFCETGTGGVQAIALIELAKAGWVEPVELSDRCWPVLVHQVLAMALAEEGVPPEAAWSHLSQVPDFKGIHRAEFERLIAWMLRDQALVLPDEKIDELARQVEAMTVALERLYALLSERPAGGGKRRAKPSPAQLAELQKTTAYKARVAPRRVARALRARRQAPARGATARPDFASRAVPADSSVTVISLAPPTASACTSSDDFEAEFAAERTLLGVLRQRWMERVCDKDRGRAALLVRGRLRGGDEGRSLAAAPASGP